MSSCATDSAQHRAALAALVAAAERGAEPVLAAAPAALVNGQPYARLDGMSLIEAVAEETQS